MVAPVQPGRIGWSGAMRADLPLIFTSAQQCDENIRFGAMARDFGEWRIGIVDRRVARVSHASVDERPVAGQVDGVRMQPHWLTQVAFGAGAGAGEYLRPFFRTRRRAVNRSSIAGQHGVDGRDGSVVNNARIMMRRCCHTVALAIKAGWVRDPRRRTPTSCRRGCGRGVKMAWRESSGIVPAPGARATMHADEGRMWRLRRLPT